MNELEHKIFRKFKSEPSRELSTSAVVREVIPNEYRWVWETLSGIREKAQLVVAKRKKGQLHRKVLYYLNKLAQKEAILQTRVVGKGEKYFILNIQGSKSSPVFESRAVQLITPIEGYEKEGLIQKGESWSNRLGAIWVDASAFSGIFKLHFRVLL